MCGVEVKLLTANDAFGVRAGVEEHPAGSTYLRKRGKSTRERRDPRACTFYLGFC